MVHIEFPVDSVDQFDRPATRYDESANGLIDVRVTWSDSESGLDPSTARIEVLGEIAGTASPHDDLTDLWTEVERDAEGATYEETYEQLVRRGTPRLVASVEDSAGNRGADTLHLYVRYADYHRSIQLSYEPGAPTLDLVVCEDDGRLYAARGLAVSVFDAVTFGEIGVFPTVVADAPSRLLCIPGDPMLYATVRIQRFNRATLAWDTEVAGTFRTHGIAASRLDADLIWAGEFGNGVPTQIDRSVPERIGGVGLPVSSFSDEFTFAVALLDQDQKIYYSRFWEGGLVVGDPATGEEVGRVDLDPNGPSTGITDNAVVSIDDRYVYAAARGLESGLVEIATQTDQVARRVLSVNGQAIDVALHPDGDLLWLTTHDDDPAAPTPSLLIDSAGMEILESFPRPVPDGAVTTWVLSATFHPNGRLLYQARDDEIDIYLIR